MNVIHRTTKQYLTSVNTPDYPPADWIHSPDLSLVAGFDIKYWIIIGDTVSLMSQSARDAVDLVELESAKDSTAETIDTDPYLRAFALVMLDEINILRAHHGESARTAAQLKTAVRSKI